MNQPLIRFVVTSPAWIPLLWTATMLDWMFFPYYRQFGCDPAAKVSEVAFKVMGV